MKEVLLSASLIIEAISIVAIFVGIVMQFTKKHKQIGLKIITASIFAFIIGFGTCVASIN